MTILHKLITIAVFTFALLSGCRMLPPSDKPLLAEEGSLPQAELAGATVTIETAPPPATPAPPTPPANKRSVSVQGERSIKPRLSYSVSEGEPLWAIAKRTDVYGDPLLWPLLYQANRDQIKDPRQIYAGQTLAIPRNVSDEDREKARNLAKNSDIFSPE